MAPTMEENPVTGVKEPYFPEKTRLSRMFTGSMVIIMMVRPCFQVLVLFVPNCEYEQVTVVCVCVPLKRSCVW